MTLCLNKMETSSPIQGCFCAKFGCNWLSVSGEEDENVKENKDRQVDDGQQVIRKAQMSNKKKQHEIIFSSFVLPLR